MTSSTVAIQKIFALENKRRSKKMQLEETNYDVVIVGTGMVEALLGGYCLCSVLKE